MLLHRELISCNTPDSKIACLSSFTGNIYDKLLQEVEIKNRLDK